MLWADTVANLGNQNQYGDGIAWRLVKHSNTEGTLSFDGSGWSDSVVPIQTLLSTYLTEINAACASYGVPVELLLAIPRTEGYFVLGDPTIGPFNESTLTWNPNYRRELSGFVDDATTPDRVVIGLTSVLLSDAQRFLDSSLTATDLMVPQTNFNACAMSIVVNSGRTKYDPMYVFACYNQQTVQLDETSDFRMVRYDGNNDGAFYRFAAFFNDALSLYPLSGAGATGISYGDMIFYWVLPPPFPWSQDYVWFYPESVAVIADGVTIVSTLSTYLNRLWPVDQAYLIAMSITATNSYTGNDTSPFFTFQDFDGVDVVMTGVELIRLYGALVGYASEVLAYDIFRNQNHGTPDPDHPLPSSATVTIP